MLLIECHSVSKKFYYYHERSKTLRGAFLDLFKGCARLNGEWYTIKDFDLEVHRNETVGLIGRNGSGNSTILKLISKVYRPTSGYIRTQGKVVALLELGAAFHPELTGRENIYLNGSILGLSKKEIEQKFDPIVSFSELSQFLDTPVKYYSSGMYARLGFSIAIFANPDILLIDEVLAVGDEEFKQKCWNKIDQFQKEGKTILLVSHDLDTIKKLCSRVVWLENGMIQREGEPEEVIQAYHTDISLRNQ